MIQITNEKQINFSPMINEIRTISSKDQIEQIKLTQMTNENRIFC